MGTFDKKINEILTVHNGAKFYWADLHVHTPKWQGFSLPSKISRDNKKEIAKLYIEKAKKEDIKILAITEHNDVEWIDPIREASRGSDVIVFPGFEITTDSGADGIHILCLFNPNTSQNTLDGILSNLGLLPERRFHNDGSPKAITKNMSEAIKIIKGQDGICIAAHVSSDNGLLKKAEGQIRIELFKNPDLLACEIPNGREKLGKFEKSVITNEYTLYQRKRPIACLNSSDAKSIDEIGKKKTFIKLSSFTVEGLREAFIDWESRIRLLPDQPEVPHWFSKIIGAYWEGGFLNGITLHFNDNLNCIIGGKGTGKSTIVETLRYVFDLKPKSDKCDEQYKSILKEVFRSGSKISVLVESHETHPKKYIIERIYPDSPVVKEIDGTVRSNLKPCDILCAEIYSQKEIYEISRNPAFQMELLDRFMGKKLDNLKEKERDLLKVLEDNKNDYLRLKRAVISVEEKIASLPVIEEKIKRYKEHGIHDRLGEKRLYTREEHILKQGLSKIKKYEEIFINFRQDIDLDTTFLKQIDNLPNKKLLENAEKILNELSNKTSNSLEKLNSVVIEALRSYEDDVIKIWEGLNKKQNETYAQILRELQMEFESVDPNELIQLEQKLEQLKLIKMERDKYEKELGRIVDDRNKMLIALIENRAEQFRVRDNIIERLNETLNGTVTVALEFQGEKEAFIERLKLLKSKAPEDQLTRIIETEGFSPVEFAKHVKEGAEKLAERFGISSARAQALCKVISEEELFNIEVFNIPTKAIIKLNLGSKEHPKYKEIDHLSVGQKCTALLTLILLENPFPLIIDQPEDDLDNTFIVEDIVNKLRKEKERRQFIITTHNANLPVLGDAELIVALTASANNALIEKGRFGSIDEESIKEVVKNILEGGKQAFDMRKEKYGL